MLYPHLCYVRIAHTLALSPAPHLTTLGSAHHEGKHTVRAQYPSAGIPISQKALEPTTVPRQSLNNKRDYRSTCSRTKVIVEILQSENLATYDSTLVWGDTLFSVSSGQLSKAEGISAIYCSAHWQHYSNALCRQGWVRTCWQCQVAIEVWSVHHCIPVIGCMLHCPQMETVPKDWLGRVSQ